MRFLRKWYVLALATVGALAAGVGSATGAPAHIELRLSVTNLPQAVLDVSYNTGIVGIDGALVRSYDGAIRSVIFAIGGVQGVAEGGSTPWRGDFESFVSVDAPRITGDATIPAGASVTLTNVHTNQTIDIHTGHFSIATGLP